jgi:hypothetical protein
MKKLGSLQYAIIALTVITAVIHLALGLFLGEINPMFVLNGVGYLALAAALYFIPQLAGQRSLIRWVLMGYTALTIVLYFVLTPNIMSPVGLADKAVELILVILLWVDRKN